MKYNFKEIESKWQAKWERDPYFKAENNSSKKKFYCLDMFPYPSASGLHVGHWKGYVFSDVFARKKWLEGYNVLHPMGWDAFGLPAENDAIKKGLHPKFNTQKNIDNFTVQLKKIGAIYDWSREVNTTDSSYYKWTQWIFLKMFQHGLAYQEMVPVNWCPKCLTGLANEEAVGGACDRCKSPVEQKPLRQWVLKITKYADALDADLDLLDWPEKVKLMQRHWIGKSKGSEVNFKLKDRLESVTVFTTRIDTLAGVTFLVLAQDHDLANILTTEAQKSAVEEYLQRNLHQTDMDKMLDKNKDGVFTGSYAINPLTGAEIPVYLANFVLKNYGTGAVMSVPAHDQRDFEFAKKFNLPVIEVIKLVDESLVKRDQNQHLLESFTADKDSYGLSVVINSGRFDGINSPKEACDQICAFLEQTNQAKPVYKYKLRDWIFSRQRYWGEPIPLVHCDDCGTVAVSESDLPILLPEVESYLPTGTGESPLAGISDWVNTSCPKCQKPAKRETNTMPQWAGSCWYFLRYVSPVFSDKLADPKAIDYWMPVDLYVGGIEHAVLHLLYARFYVKFLHEIGVVNFKEPFKHLFNQGMVCMKSSISGRVEKMSKSKGNVVNPDEIVDSLGSDCLRMYMLFMGPAEQDTEWNTESIKGVSAFLGRLWTFLVDPKNLALESVSSITTQKRFYKFLKDFVCRINEFKVNTAVASIMELYNDLTRHEMHLDKNLLRKFLTAISIIVPHFASELFVVLLGEELKNQSWPEIDESLILESTSEIIIQVNGKLRGSLSVPKDSTDQAVIDLATPLVQKWIADKTILKTIVVKEKLVNFVVSQ